MHSGWLLITVLCILDWHVSELRCSRFKPLSTHIVYGVPLLDGALETVILQSFNSVHSLL
jgi:hypothetical protein